MLKLLNQLLSEERQRIETATLNRGYDSADFLNALREMNIKPVIDNRKLRKGDKLVQYKNTAIYYSEAGEVFINDRAIEEEKIDPETGYPR